MAPPKKAIKAKMHSMTIDPILFKILEDWRWQNRMSRSKAICLILEKFFASLDQKKGSKAQQEINMKDL